MAGKVSAEAIAAQAARPIEVKLLGMTCQVPPKTFASGKRGYFGQAKLSANGRTYQFQVQLVEITPKATTGGMIVQTE